MIKSILLAFAFLATTTVTSSAFAALSCQEDCGIIIYMGGTEEEYQACFNKCETKRIDTKMACYHTCEPALDKYNDESVFERCYDKCLTQKSKK
ncbi:hypothetical protein [Bdellovibrio reynosensis]|uniref:Cys-rich protein n=1 Tax=Bdellovibrio reynosensis TaxID=2835041 RepID=A0ABY4C8Y8_9BACT|nr:hypothetical protein [Bdellovibrio reynosensis]UOF01400.1 hypothetical protein MNR06_00340 [Bdellovibrio reynosensis]